VLLLIDIVVFREADDCHRSTSGCDWTKLGVGASDSYGNLRWCCANDAIQLSMCTGKNDYGRLILNASLFKGSTRSMTIDANGKQEIHVSSPLLSVDEGSGNYVMVMANCNDEGRTVNNQIFEDYGALDNSLFLEAFGFVPYENPFHCVPIQLPPIKIHTTEAILKHLDPSITDLDGQVKFYNSACVLLDGSLSDQRAYTYLALVALERGERRYYDRCVNAVGSGQDIKLYCVDYLDRRSAVASVLRESAKAALDHSPTSLDFDVDLFLRKSVPNNTADSLRSITALRFRLEDKKVLTEIANKFF